MYPRAGGDLSGIKKAPAPILQGARAITHAVPPKDSSGKRLTSHARNGRDSGRTYRRHAISPPTPK